VFLLERLGDAVVVVSRNQHVLREVHLHPMPLANGDRGGYLEKLVENGSRRTGDAAGGSGGESLRAAGRDGSASLLDFSGPGNQAKRDRRSEYLQVVVVDLVFQGRLADLIETGELVEVDAEAARRPCRDGIYRDGPGP
jgi:hypothetical protein